MSHKQALRNEQELRLDRLVDGELSAQEYRALLAALDEEPDSWRRCAMAFLEAQTLGQELCRLRERALHEIHPAADNFQGNCRGRLRP